MGMRALSAQEGLALFDRALTVDEALLIPVSLDTAGLRAQARTSSTVPALLRGLIQMPARRAKAGVEQSLARRLANVPEGEREGMVLELVRTHVARLLGHPSSAAVGAQQPFRDMGVDSLGALELRSRLVSATGIALPATLVFDYPTPSAVAGLLLENVGQVKRTSPMKAELDKLEIALSSMAADDAERSEVGERLQALLTQLNGSARPEGSVAVAEKIGSASADEVFDFIDKELGS